MAPSDNQVAFRSLPYSRYVNKVVGKADEGGVEGAADLNRPRLDEVHVVS